MGLARPPFSSTPPTCTWFLKQAQEGKTLPQKSTYFHPKPPSGMVFSGSTQIDLYS